MANSVFPSGGAASIVQQATVTLTDAQIKALPTDGTGFDLVAAPGAGLVLIPLNWLMVYSAITAAYTNVNADARLTTSYGPDDSWSPYGPIRGDGVLADALLTESTLAPLPSSANVRGSYVDPLVSGFLVSNFSAPTAEVANLPFTLFLDNRGDGNLTGGNAANTLTVSMSYLVLNTTTGAFVTA